MPRKSIFSSAVAASNSAAFGFTCVRERDPFLRSREETHFCAVERERCDEMSESKRGKLLLYLYTMLVGE